MKFKRLPKGDAPEVRPLLAEKERVRPLTLSDHSSRGALGSESARSVVAEAVPRTHRERALDLVHKASDDGYDLDLACQTLHRTTTDSAVVVVVVTDSGTFGCFLSRLPVKRDKTPDVEASLFRLASDESFWIDYNLHTDDPSAFVVAARTDAFLAVGLDAKSGGAALRIDASLSSGSSYVSALFKSPRLHAAESDDFEILDFELYALQPHRR